MKSKFLILTFTLALAGLISAGERRSVQASEVGTKIEIIGDLGIPVGKIATITGRKENNGPGVNTFLVATVNGQKKNTSIQVIGIDDWPEGTRAELTGMEVGTILYLTEAYANYARNDPRWKGPRQVFSLEFKVKSIIAPSNLRLKNEEAQQAVPPNWP